MYVLCYHIGKQGGRILLSPWQVLLDGVVLVRRATAVATTLMMMLSGDDGNDIIHQLLGMQCMQGTLHMLSHASLTYILT